MYELAGKELTGKVAVKLHSGEKEISLDQTSGPR